METISGYEILPVVASGWLGSELHMCRLLIKEEWCLGFLDV